MATRSPAGFLAGGEVIEIITLRNKNGVTARILTLGATLQSLLAPDRTGEMADVVLGFDDAQSYTDNPGFFGCTIGRYANRIAGGRFVIDGQPYQAPLNDGPNSLHGGGDGFDSAIWRIADLQDGVVAKVVLKHHSPDGEAGYPGALDVSVTYALDEDNALSMLFEATTDATTIVNMTNHATFNLAGEGAPDGAMGHLLTIPAPAFTPVDDTLIPTGEVRAVADTAFDFRTPRTIGERIRESDEQLRFARGYDHNFALAAGLTAEPHLAARLEDPASGRVLDVFTTEPGLQVYSGNFLDGARPGKGGRLYRMGDGIALEPQKFPDAPNKPYFVSARVDPGKPYRHLMIYRFSVQG